jgi:histidinol-phosphate aminotransferase
MSTKITRRDWLRKGLVASGAMTMGSMAGISPSLGRALFEDDQQIVYASSLSELKTPQFANMAAIKARLSANENPHGPSPKALEAFKGYASNGNYYSWRELYTLVDKIAEKEGVKKENIMMGPGSSDLLEKTALVTFMKGGNIISCDPPYMSLINVAKSMGGTWKPVKLTKDYQHDLKAMEKAIDADTKLIYITNPNNPTATITDYEALYKFCEKVSDKVPIFLDEAYLELADAGLKHSMVSLVAKGKNVIVSRTFSKIYGMAGLRMGYMVALESTLDKIQAITRGGMGITGPSIMAAIASIEDKEFEEKSKTLIKEARDFTCSMLKAKGIDYMPSQTNFVMFPLGMEGDVYQKKMMEHGVALRVFKFWDKTWCRVSIGTMDDMKLFASAFEKIVG